MHVIKTEEISEDGNFQRDEMYYFGCSLSSQNTNHKQWNGPITYETM